MRKRLSILLCLALVLSLLTGCASQTLSKARTAYANGDYQQAVELLESLKNRKPEAEQLLINAKAWLAYQDGDYQQVVELLKDAQVEDTALKGILEESEAALALEAKRNEAKELLDAGEYQAVVDLIGGEEESEELLAILNDARAAIAEAEEAAKAAEARLALLTEAQAALEAGEYDEVLNLLKEADADDVEAAALVEQAENALAEIEAELQASAHVREDALKTVKDAFRARDYEQVTELLTGELAEFADEAPFSVMLGRAKTILEEAEKTAKDAAEARSALLAEAQAALDAHEYNDVLSLLAEEDADDVEIASIVEQAESALAEIEAELQASAQAREDALKSVKDAFRARDYEQVTELLTGELAEFAAEAPFSVMLGRAETILEEQKAAEEAAAVLEAKLNEARRLLDSGDWQAVVALIGGEEENEELLAILADAQTAIEEEERAAKEAAEARLALLTEAQAALQAGEYDEVLSLLAEEDADDAEIASLIEEAESALAEIEAELQTKAQAREAALETVKDAFRDRDYEQVTGLLAGELAEYADDAPFSVMLGRAETILEEQMAAEEAAAALEAKRNEAMTLFASGDWQAVVDLIGTEEESEELLAILNDAQTALEEEEKAAEEAVRAAELQAAFEAEDYATVISLLANTEDRDTNELYRASVIGLGKQLIRETGDEQRIQLPADESWLEEFRTEYVIHMDYDGTPLALSDPEHQQRPCGPCVSVERVPEPKSGRLTMPWAYEGVKVTVLAEENGMSCVLYESNEYEPHAGWVQTRFLQDTFPNAIQTVGTASDTVTEVRNDITMQWSRKGFLNSAQNYSVLSETVENCVGFTLDYQLIKENTWEWNCIYGPRSIYVYDGAEWTKVGSFDYPYQGTAEIVVNLEKPMSIAAIGTIAEVGLPNTFWFRQVAFDYQIAG